MNSFGQNIRFQIFGESHSHSIGGILDGIPSGIKVDFQLIQSNLERRKSNSFATTPRKETDEVQFFSGIKNGITTGTPIGFALENKTHKPEDYHFEKTPRPGHSDFTQMMKYGENADISGGGHSSGRLTAALIVAGSIAQMAISLVKFEAKIEEIGGKKDWEELLKKTAEEGDSLGGIVSCTISGIPAGIGEPFFRSVESALSQMMFSIPGVKAIEFGAGFLSAEMLGSEFNDPIIDKSGKTSTNNTAGISGGITNGNDIYFRLAFRPTSSIKKPQKTINLETGETQDLQVEGRHDVCYTLRTPVIVECASALAIADLMI
jgi:chorismate synthase